MDFLRKSATQTHTVNTAAQHAPVAGHTKDFKNSQRWGRIAAVAFLLAITGLIVALALLVFFGGARKEASLVDSKKYQAVFLTNGQVYFGKVKEANTKYVDLRDIYYLNSQTTENNAQPTSFSLVKLGCELHKPADMMVINRDQVSFWENIQTDGKVAKVIDQWKAENPNGQQCTEQTNTTQQSQSNNQQQNTTNNTNAAQQNTDTNKKTN